eukprot:Gb_24026 [translate_table: standard]
MSSGEERKVVVLELPIEASIEKRGIDRGKRARQKCRDKENVPSNPGKRPIVGGVPCKERDEEGNKKATKIEQVVDEDDAMEDGDDDDGCKQTDGAPRELKIQTNEKVEEEVGKVDKEPKEGAKNDQERSTNEQQAVSERQNEDDKRSKGNWTNGQKKIEEKKEKENCEDKLCLFDIFAGDADNLKITLEKETLDVKVLVDDHKDHVDAGKVENWEQVQDEVGQRMERSHKKYKEKWKEIAAKRWGIFHFGGNNEFWRTIGLILDEWAQWLSKQIANRDFWREGRRTTWEVGKRKRGELLAQGSFEDTGAQQTWREEGEQAKEAMWKICRARVATCKQHSKCERRRRVVGDERLWVGQKCRDKENVPLDPRKRPVVGGGWTVRRAGCINTLT